MADIIHTHELTQESIRNFADRKIALSQGKFATVSVEDFDRINARKWFYHKGAQERAARSSLRKMIYMHHEVLHLESSELRSTFREVDHINGNPLDNRRENLRIVTHSENMQNSSSHHNFKGFSYHKPSGRWIAYVNYPFYCRVSLGYYNTAREAEIVAAFGQDMQKVCANAPVMKRQWKDFIKGC